MKFKIFTVFDSKAEAFNTPFFLAAKGQAVRAFEDEVNSENSEFSKHPEDYTLFCLGEYDSDTGAITPIKLESLGTALEHRRLDQ